MKPKTKTFLADLMLIIARALYVLLAGMLATTLYLVLQKLAQSGEKIMWYHYAFYMVPLDLMLAAFIPLRRLPRKLRISYVVFPIALTFLGASDCWHYYQQAQKPASVRVGQVGQALSASVAKVATKTAAVGQELRFRMPERNK